MDLALALIRMTSRNCVSSWNDSTIGYCTSSKPTTHHLHSVKSIVSIHQCFSNALKIYAITYSVALSAISAPAYQLFYLPRPLSFYVSIWFWMSHPNFSSSFVVQVSFLLKMALWSFCFAFYDFKECLSWLRLIHFYLRWVVNQLGSHCLCLILIASNSMLVSFSLFHRCGRTHFWLCSCPEWSSVTDPLHWFRRFL